MIKIVADSTAGISKEYQKKNDIEVAYLNLLMNGATCKDGEISNVKIEEALKKKNKVSTSQPSPNEFLDAYNRQIDKGCREIIVITVSKELSGTYQSAEIAKGLVLDKDVKITIINSKTASIGEEVIVRKTVELIKLGDSYEEVVKKVNQYVNNVITMITLDNLNSLVRTGRVSMFKAFLGNVMKVKPILEIIDGKVVNTGKVRTIKKVIDSMVLRVAEFAKDSKKPIDIYISYVTSDKFAHNLMTKIKTEVPNTNPIIVEEIGPVLSVHLGYGGFGLAMTRD